MAEDRRRAGLYAVLTVAGFAGWGASQRAETIDLMASASAVNSSAEQARRDLRALQAKRAEISSLKDDFSKIPAWKRPRARVADHVWQLNLLLQAALAIRDRVGGDLRAYRAARRKLGADVRAIEILGLQAVATQKTLEGMLDFEETNRTRALAAIAADLPLPRVSNACAGEATTLSEGELAELLPLMGSGAADQPGAGPRESSLVPGYQLASEMARNYRYKGMRPKSIEDLKSGGGRLVLCGVKLEPAEPPPVDVIPAAANLVALEQDVREAGEARIRENDWPGVNRKALFGKLPQAPPIEKPPAAIAALLAAPNPPPPPTDASPGPPPISIAGDWESSSYNCKPDRNISEVAHVVQQGSNVTAIKTKGDKCVLKGEVTWYTESFPPDAKSYPVSFPVMEHAGPRGLQSLGWYAGTAVLVGPNELRVETPVKLSFTRSRS